MTLVYIEDIINPYIVKELDRRLQSIVTDVVFETGTIEQLIQDNNLSPFPQFLNTERPDNIVASLTKGKAAILVDGSPFALIAPLVFVDIFQSVEDHYERWVIGTLLRILRMGSGIVAILMPAMYVASFRITKDLFLLNWLIRLLEQEKVFLFLPILKR